MVCPGRVGSEMCTRMAEGAHGLHRVTSDCSGWHGSVRTGKADVGLPMARRDIPSRLEASSYLNTKPKKRVGPGPSCCHLRLNFEDSILCFESTHGLWSIKWVLTETKVVSSKPALTNKWKSPCRLQMFIRSIILALVFSKWNKD